MENILTQLTQKFPILENVPLSIIETNEDSFHGIIICTRSENISIAVGIHTKNIKELFDCFNVPVPAVLNTISNYATHLLIDLDSIVSDSLRFYVYGFSITDDGIKNMYPFDYSLDTFNSEENPGLLGIGFRIEMSTGSIPEYKYYWTFNTGRIVKNYRFNAAGEFINLKIENSEEDISKEKLASIDSSLDINFNNYIVNHVIRVVGENHDHIAIEKRKVQGPPEGIVPPPPALSALPPLPTLPVLRGLVFPPETF